jgi:hypothetical protein
MNIHELLLLIKDAVRCESQYQAACEIAKFRLPTSEHYIPELLADANNAWTVLAHESYKCENRRMTNEEARELKVGDFVDWNGIIGKVEEVYDDGCLIAFDEVIFFSNENIAKEMELADTREWS